MPATDIIITDISSDALTPVVTIDSVDYVDGDGNYIAGDATGLGLTAAFVSGDLGRISWGTVLQTFLKSHYLSAGNSDVTVTYTVSTPQTANYKATSLTDVFSISIENSVITWNQCDELNSMVPGDTILGNASATGGDVVYTSSDNSVISILNSSISAVAGGTVTVSCSTSGNDCFLPSLPVDCIVTVPDPSLFISTGTESVAGVTQTHTYQYTYFDTSSAAIQTITLTGNAITGDVTGSINTGASNFQYSTGGAWTDCITDIVIGNSLINNTTYDIQFRLKHDLPPFIQTPEVFTFTNPGITTNPAVTLLGSVTRPLIGTATIVENTLDGFTYQEGDGPSVTQTFRLTGENIPPTSRIVYRETSANYNVMIGTTLVDTSVAGQLITTVPGYNAATGELDQTYNVQLVAGLAQGAALAGAINIAINVPILGTQQPYTLGDTINFLGSITAPPITVNLNITPGAIDDIDISLAAQQDIYLVCDNSGSMDRAAGTGNAPLVLTNGMLQDACEDFANNPNSLGLPAVGRTLRRSHALRLFIGTFRNNIRNIIATRDGVDNQTYKIHFVKYNGSSGERDRTANWITIDDLTDNIIIAYCGAGGGTSHSAALNNVITMLNSNNTDLIPRPTARTSIIHMSDGDAPMPTAQVNNLGQRNNTMVYPVLLGSVLNPYNANCQWVTTAGYVSTRKDIQTMFEIGRIGQNLALNDRALTRFVYTDFIGNNCSMNMQQALEQLQMYLAPGQGSFTYTIENNNVNNIDVQIPIINNDGSLNNTSLVYTPVDQAANIPLTDDLDPIDEILPSLFLVTPVTNITIPSGGSSTIQFVLNAKCPIPASAVRNLRIRTLFDVSQFTNNFAGDQSSVGYNITTGNNNTAVPVAGNTFNIISNVVDVVGDDSARPCANNNVPAPATQYDTGILSGQLGQLFLPFGFQRFIWVDNFANAVRADCRGFNSQNITWDRGEGGDLTRILPVIFPNDLTVILQTSVSQTVYWNGDTGATFTHNLNRQDIGINNVIMTGYPLVVPQRFVNGAVLVELMENNPINLTVTAVNTTDPSVTDANNQVHVRYALPTAPGPVGGWGNMTAADWPGTAINLDDLGAAARSRIFAGWQLQIVI